MGIGRAGAAACWLGLAVLFSAEGGDAAERVIFDTDFNTIGDDGQAFVMLAGARAEGKVEILGMTVVSGNQWLDQEMADALRAVERMGLAGEVPVYRGALDPLLHSPATLALEQQLYGKGYAGAWRKPRPGPDDLTAPPDGFARTARPAAGSAVDFIIETVRRYPREVTILAVGPLTNLALAFREAPDIVPLIERIVYMGGAVDVPGNVTPAAEFNWWFDPEAAKIVLREPIEHVVIPLDVTDKTRFGKDVFDRIVAADTPVTRLFEAAYREDFAADPAARAEIWDTIAVGYVLDPSLATDLREVWLDIDATFGPSYGRSLGHRKNPPIGAQKAKVVFDIDRDRFWPLYVDLLSRPVPEGGG